MAQPHTESGRIVSVLPLADALPAGRTTAILKADQLEIVRVVLLAGAGLPEHAVRGEITLQCLEGRVELRTSVRTLSMEAGDLVHLRASEPHALQAAIDSSLLLTICLLA